MCSAVATFTSMRVRWLVLGLLLVGLLVPAVMITAARVLQLDDGRAIRLVAFTPYATFLYALALFLALVALAASRRFWRRASGLLVLFVLPLLVLHLAWASGPYVGQVPEAGGETFTVMTANLSFGDADPAQVVELAAVNRVDAMVLSEITPDALTRMNDAGLPRVLPHSAGEAAPGVSGTMVFTADEISTVTRLDTGFNGYVMTISTDDFGTVELAAVHPHPPMDDAAIWKRDHEIIRAHVARTTASEARIIAGDFNATPDHAVLHELEDLGFRNGTKVANSHWQPTWPAAGEMSVLGVAVPSMLQIDHVLAAGRARVVNTESVTIRGTDHRAVVATLARPWFLTGQEPDS